MLAREGLQRNQPRRPRARRRDTLAQTRGIECGSKGGVAAGVVVFVLGVAGLVLYYLRLAKRKKRARAAAAQSNGMKKGDHGKDLLPPEADAGFAVQELAPRDRKPELDSMAVSEMGGGSGKPSELANTSAPAELSAENPRDISGRGC